MSDKFQDIALFRYRVIAPVCNETGIGQRRYFRRMSEKEFDVPHLGKTRYKPGTFKNWLKDYRMGGFDALRPKPRIDRSKSRKIDEFVDIFFRSFFPSLAADVISGKLL